MHLNSHVSSVPKHSYVFWLSFISICTIYFCFTCGWIGLLSVAQLMPCEDTVNITYCEDSGLGRSTLGKSEKLGLSYVWSRGTHTSHRCLQDSGLSAQPSAVRNGDFSKYAIYIFGLSSFLALVYHRRKKKTSLWGNWIISIKKKSTVINYIYFFPLSKFSISYLIKSFKISFFFFRLTLH